jgi:hypothetical protein
MLRVWQALAIVCGVSLLVASYLENNIYPGVINSPYELLVEQPTSVSLSGAYDWDMMESMQTDGIGDVTWSADLDVTFVPSVGMSTMATVNSLPDTSPEIIEVDFTITAVVDDTAAYVDDGPSTVSKPAKGKGKHRGRIQIQGDDMNPEVSWAWNQDTPPTKSEMLTQLNSLYDGLTNAQKNARKDAIVKARKYIEDLPAGGANAKVSKTWQDTGKKTERIDLEIITGKAGTD